MDVRSNGFTADTAQLFIPIVDKSHFESFSGIPIKQIRDNAITTLDLKGADGAQLEACGGVVLAHSLKTNTSVTSVSQNICVYAFSSTLRLFGDVRPRRLCGRMRRMLRCFATPLRAVRGLERRCQPCTKLFAKVAVQNLAASLIWAFVGVFCAMFVSWDIVVCLFA